MNALAKRFSPSATDLLRADHTRVVAVFHRYAAVLSPRVKQGLVENVCLMLEMHAQIEEELFYPQMRVADAALVEKSVPEHDRMRALIAALRGTAADSPDYDEIFFRLMHEVLHHVADEETRLFPDAERLFPEELSLIGAQMAKRRLQLGARAVPISAIAVAVVGLLTGAVLYRQAFRR